MTKIRNHSNNQAQRSIGNPPPRLQQSDRSHTVRRGDNLTQIAASNDMSLRDLVQANPQVQNPDKIWPGDQIRIPAAANTAPPTNVTANTNQNDSFSTNDRGASQTTNTSIATSTTSGADANESTSLPSNLDSSPARPGELARQNEASLSGRVWGTTLDNGAEVSALGGSITSDSNGTTDARGHIVSLDRGDLHVGVGEVHTTTSAEVNVNRVNLRAGAEATAIVSTTGDNHTVDVGSKIGDVGGEATFHVEADGSEGRIGAGYRANIAEVSTGLGSVSDASTNDFRQEARIAVGAPSAGIFASWGDRDNDGATNYRVDIDVPIPGTPLGVGISLESETPIRDGLAAVLSVSNPIAQGYLLGRSLKFW